MIEYALCDGRTAQCDRSTTLRDYDLCSPSMSDIAVQRCLRPSH